MNTRNSKNRHSIIRNPKGSSPPRAHSPINKTSSDGMTNVEVKYLFKNRQTTNTQYCLSTFGEYCRRSQGDDTVLRGEGKYSRFRGQIMLMYA